MSTTLEATGAPAQPAAAARWTRDRVRRTAAYAGVVGLGLVLVVLLALSAQRPTGALDPENPGPEGGRALAEVLRTQGVEVEVVRSIDALEASRPGADTTVFVGDPTDLGPGATERLAVSARPAGRMVLLGVGGEQLTALGMPVDAFPGGGDALVAGCSSEVARRSDVVTAWDTRYLVQGDAPGATSCFVLPSTDGPPDGPPDRPDPDGRYGAAMVQLDATAAHPEAVLAGLGPAWTNELITDDSHAGTAVRALGSTPRLVWYQPGTGDAFAPGPGGIDPLGGGSVWPSWTGPAIVLLLSAVVLLALSRGRRLGPLVHEPLPVVVRAIETTESRGRLYRKAGDRARAAAVLRAGSSQRLARRLALGRGAGPDALVHAVSLSTGLPGPDVADILCGPAPADDTALIHLAQQLTDLEERVRHP